MLAMRQLKEYQNTSNCDKTTTTPNPTIKKQRSLSSEIYQSFLSGHGPEDGDSWQGGGGGGCDVASRQGE